MLPPACCYPSLHNESFAICGRTIESLRRNVIVHLPSWLEGLFKVTERRAENKLIISVGGHSNTYYLFGGRDESSYTLVQGMTLAGVLFDEVALMPRSFVEQALARCSVAGSKFWFNCNPEGPMHWFYKEWVLECKRRNVLHLHFTMADNLSLSEKIKQRYEGMYTGVFYARYILGKWTKAEGLVYPFFDAKKHMIDDDGSRGRYYISCDYGTLNPCVFGLWRVNGNSAFMVKEYYYDGRKKGKQKTDEEYYDRANGYAHTSPTDAFKAKLAEAGVDLSVRFARVMPKAKVGPAALGRMFGVSEAYCGDYLKKQLGIAFQGRTTRQETLRKRQS